MSGIEIIYTRLFIPIEMLLYGISEKCLPHSPFSQYIPFFLQNIWHSIFDQFQFHYILGTKWLNHQVRQEKVLQQLENNSSEGQQKDFRGQLNAYQREELQIIESAAGESTKSYIFQILIPHWRGQLIKDASSSNDLICHSKNLNFLRSPLTLLPISPRYLTKKGADSCHRKFG